MILYINSGFPKSISLCSMCFEKLELDIYRFLSVAEQSAAQVMHRIPYGEPSHCQYGEKHDNDIPEMHAHRVGVDDEGTAGAS